MNGRVGARVLATLCVAATATFALPATAQAGSSLQAAKAKLNKLNSQADHLDNTYNKAKDEWQVAKTKQAALNKSVAQDRQTYQGLRVRVAQLAADAYKTDNAGDIPALVSSNDPGAVLDQMSAFTQLSRNRSAEVTQFLNSAQLLQRQQAEAQQATSDMSAQKKALDSQRAKIKKIIAKQQALVDRLGGTTSGTGGFTGTASGNAGSVLQWVRGHLGIAYVFGGNGPPGGMDCSRFVQEAWAAAGVSLPRTVPEQYSATRHVSQSAKQPGDIIFFDSLGHDGIYVGNGEVAHEPHTGQSSQVIPIWTSSYLVGRP